MSRIAPAHWHVAYRLEIAGVASPRIVYVARGFPARLFGWHALGPQQRREALWLPSCSVVHGIGLRTPLDVAFVDRDGVVLALGVLHPGRIVRGPRACRATLESAHGSHARWGIRRGVTLRWSAFGVPP